MKSYNYQETLKALWEKAVEKYRAGVRSEHELFEADELDFLASIGINSREMFDYAEDFVNGGEPDFATVAMVTDIRRSYFLETMKGQRSDKVVTTECLPAKSESVRGIDWLPRIIPKAKAKLRGEMDPDLMYGCGGDRNFFRTNDIHPAEFLRVVRDNIDNDEAVIDWVEARTKSAQPA